MSRSQAQAPGSLLPAEQFGHLHDFGNSHPHSPHPTSITQKLSLGKLHHSPRSWAGRCSRQAFCQLLKDSGQGLLASRSLEPDAAGPPAPTALCAELSGFCVHLLSIPASLHSTPTMLMRGVCVGNTCISVCLASSRTPEKCCDAPGEWEARPAGSALDVFYRHSKNRCTPATPRAAHSTEPHSNTLCPEAGLPSLSLAGTHTARGQVSQFTKGERLPDTVGDIGLSLCEHQASS